VRYLFRSGLTSPLLVRGPHYTHVYLLHAVYCQTLLASQLDFETYFTRSSYTISGARVSISEEGSSGLAEDINLLDAGSAARRLPPERSLTCSTCADWPVCEGTVQSRRPPKIKA
jgi:hypothetical protein